MGFGKSGVSFKGTFNKYVRLYGGRGGQPKAYSVNMAM